MSDPRETPPVSEFDACVADIMGHLAKAPLDAASVAFVVRSVLLRRMPGVDRVAALTAELAQVKQERDALRSAEPHACEWQEDDYGNFDAACGGKHVFIDGGPTENRYQFCPYCGGAMRDMSPPKEDAPQ